MEGHNHFYIRPLFELVQIIHKNDQQTFIWILSRVTYL
jgi:hypothetical protein